MTTTRRALMALLALLSAALVAAPTAFADTNFVVNSTADPGAGGCEPGGATTCSLREALQLTLDGTSAGIFGDVTIDLDVSGSIKVGAGGELVVGTGAGVDSIAIVGPGAGQLTIDGEEETRVVRLAAGTVSISGLTIARGSLLGGGAGVIAENASSLTLDGVRLADNAAGGPGGGVYLDTSGAATITDSEFAGNSTNELGGGLYTVGPATIERTTFAGNSATQAEDLAESGGGLGATGTIVLLRNSTVTGNEGGGVSSVGGEMTIRNSTVAGNSGFSLAGNLFVLQSTIVGGTLGEGVIPCLGGEVQSQGNNLVESSKEDLGCTWQLGSGDVFGADPRLGPLGSYGGPTQTLPPVSMDSPAINSGENPQSTDQRGRQRPVPDGVANTDVGAVEVQAPLLEVADPPSISPGSDLVAGETLTCAPGTWDTDTITDADFSYVWMAGAETVGSGDTYVLSADDAGKEVTCRVTVDNGVASAEAGSAAVELEAAIAALEPSTLDFGSRRVGSGPSEPQALTVTNTGGTDLVVSEVSTTNSEFPIDATDCTAAPVAPGASCEVAVRFAPVATGVQGSFVTVESNGGEPVASVSGTATEPALSLAPASVDFGDQRVDTSSDPQAIVATNVGTAPLTLGTVALSGSNPSEFAIASDDCSDAVLDPGEECTVEVAFAPDLTGPRGALLSFAGEDPGTVELSGTGTAPEFSVAPTSLDFGDQRVDTTSGPEALVVTNTGTAPLTLGEVTLGGSNPNEFAIASDECSSATLAPDEGCTVEVSFSPDLTGPRSATLSFPGEDPGSAELSGTGTAPSFAVTPASHDFGDQRIDTTSTPEAFVVENTGTASLTLGDVTLGGSNPGEFVLGTDGCSDAVLDPGEECSVQVSFSPDLVGPRSAILNFAGEDPATAELSGTGTAPVFSAAPTSVDFGQQLVSGGPSAARTVTVTNNGTASMAITTVSITGADAAQYALVAAGNECAGATLAPTEDCTVEVTFDPSQTGPAAATLSFGGQAPGTVELLGTGIAPALAIEPTSLNFGSHLVGTKSGVQPFVVKNTGSAPAEIFTISLAGSGSGSFSLGPTDSCTGATLAIGAECTVDVSFAPASVGAKAATLDVTGAASVSAPLQGTGIVASFAVTPTALSFGSREVGAGPSPAQTLTVQNTGSGAMAIESVTPTGTGAAAYAVPAASDKCTGAELDPTETCTVAVAFDPASAGAFPAALSFAGNAPGSVPLSGSGVESRFVATPGGHGFGDEIVGGSGEPVQFRIGNAGSAPMPLGPIGISGPNPSSFQLVQNGCAGLTLAPGQECGLRVALTPKAIGALRAQLDVGSLGSLELVGNGVEPPPAARLVKPKGAIKVKANGKIKARISCASMVSACRSGLTITLRRAPVARWSGNIAAGKAKTVSLRLNKPTRTELFARGKLKVLGLLGSQAGEQRTGLTLKARR